MSTAQSLKLILDEIREIKRDFKDFKQSHQQQSTEFRAIFKQLKEENSCLKDIVSDLQNQNNNLSSEMSRLSIGLNSVTQDKLSKNLMIAGIPYAEKENLPDLIVKAASALQVDISKADFKVKRMFAKERNSSSNVIVEFFDINLKQKLIKNKKHSVLLPTQLGFNHTKEILMFHQLTSYNLELLAEARNTKNKFKLKFVWYQNNQILLRRAENAKIFAVRSKKELIELNCLLEDTRKEKTVEIKV